MSVPNTVEEAEEHNFLVGMAAHTPVVVAVGSLDVEVAVHSLAEEAAHILVGGAAARMSAETTLARNLAQEAVAHSSAGGLAGHSLAGVVAVHSLVELAAEKDTVVDRIHQEHHTGRVENLHIVLAAHQSPDSPEGATLAHPAYHRMNQLHPTAS